ncbi:MAG TPA: ribose-phosphate pyrophosphokinase [Lysobacter sp.]|nr:ribose-phosphate pyrophosphokinase [Lysobacter sp.]
MPRVLLPFPAQRSMAAALATVLEARVGDLAWRRFPDGESLVRVDPTVSGCDVAIVASLDRPDEKALAVRFATETARELGARSVGLIAPYLAYMRQDRRFQPGEALSAPLFARFIADTFDWLVTADPHLHRYRVLADVYPIPTRRVETAPLLASWIAAHVPQASLVGPDAESAQWVGAVARHAGLPWQVLQKTRYGDRDVTVSLPDAAALHGRTAVVVDDIASSGQTMIEAVRRLQQAGCADIVCVAIHPVFAEDAYERLRATGVARIVSTDSIPHPSNAIGIADALAAGCAGLFVPRRVGRAA